MIPTLRQQGGDLQLRAADRRPGRRPGHRRRHRARLPGPGPGRGVRRRPCAGAAAARGATASCPTSTPSTDWDRIALFWVNYPNNPTGAMAPLAFYERLAALAREHDFLALLRRGVQRALVRRAARAPRSRSRDRANVVVFHTLSKRSSMTGYRSGFVAAPPEVISALRTYRPSTRHGAAGVRPARVGRRLGRRGARRAHARAPTGASARCSSACSRARAGGSPASEATMYLWVEVPGGESSEACADAAASSTASSSRRARSSVRPARATCASRSSRRWRSASVRRRSSRRL